MSFLYLTGSRLNLFGRGTVSVSPSAASVSAASNLYDGDPGCPLLFGSTGAGYAKVDCNALTNPGFETSTLSGWTSGDAGTGASTQTTTAGEFRSGSKALKLVSLGGVSSAIRYQNIDVRAGEYRQASFYIKTPSSGTVSLYLRNAVTLNYYRGSNGTWGSAAFAAATQAATGSWVQVSVTYQVEGYEATQSEATTIRWELQVTTSGTVCVDDCLDVPGVTFASIHGHNLAVDPTVESSDDDSSWTTRATMTRKRPAFWTSFSVVYARYWKIAWSAAISAPYFGEAVLGQYDTGSTPILRGPVTTYDLPGARDFNSLGRPSAYSYTTDPRESVHLEFSADTEAAAREAIYGIFVRSKQGQLPVVVVPLSTETAVYYGRVAQPFVQERPYYNVWDYGFDVIGDPLPTVGL